MKIIFSCPACGASGSTDEAFVGRRVRCNPCKHHFVILAPGNVEEAGGYLLDEPARPHAGAGPSNLPAGPVFVPSRGDEPSVFLSPRKPRSTNSVSKSKRSSRGGSEFAWGTWLIGVGTGAAIALAATALIAPRGVEIAGSILLFLGTAMFLIGFAAGAYGAFCEDFLYFFFYLVFPIYTAYYLVTRWEDLWRWCVCSTVGFAFVLMGTQMLRWVGVAA